MVELPFNMVFTDQFKVGRGDFAENRIEKENRPERANRRCPAHMFTLWLKKGKLIFLKDGQDTRYLHFRVRGSPLKTIRAVLPEGETDAW